MYTVDGFCKVDVVPLPRSQNQEVGPLVLKSVKWVITGEQPDKGVPEKLATGACALAEKTKHNKMPAHPKVRKSELIPSWFKKCWFVLSGIFLFREGNTSLFSLQSYFFILAIFNPARHGEPLLLFTIYCC